MPEDRDVEKFLSDLKSIEDRKQNLIDDLLRQRAAASKVFDEKLAKLGYRSPDSSGKPKKSPRKQPATQPSGNTQATSKGKAWA